MMSFSTSPRFLSCRFSSPAKTVNNSRFNSMGNVVSVDDHCLVQEVWAALPVGFPEGKPLIDTGNVKTVAFIDGQKTNPG